MKASLYAVKLNGEWVWRATLNSEVDQLYWSQRLESKAASLKVQPSLSWGQALWLQQWMNERSARWINLQKIRGELIHALTRIQAAPLLLDKLELKVEEDQLPERQKDNKMGEPAEKKPIRLVSRPKFRDWEGSVQGRALLPNEWVDLANAAANRPFPLSIASGIDELQAACLQGSIELTQAVCLRKRQTTFWRQEYELCCSRCGSGSAQMRWTFCVYCEGPCPYCESCLTMGRARFCTPLIQGREPEAFISGPAVTTRLISHWGLNEAQTDAAKAGLHFLLQTQQRAESKAPPPRSLSGNPQGFLIWAVTGAGKTEMIYPLIEHELAHGRKTMIATPRKDVVLELLPRLQTSFPQHDVVALYGGSRQRWEPGEITLATTHQLIRFNRAFDLVIIDELDAFPYHNNPMLEYAAQTACKPQGRFIFLSATPPGHLQQSAKRGKLPHVRVPVRFHRHPLPVPRLLAIPPLHKWVARKSLPNKLLKAIEHSLERGAQLFVFVSQIRHVEDLVHLFQSQFQDKVIQGTHSKDTERGEKVIDFRQTRIDLLVTTTILERGITVPKTDVFVLDADAALFDEASLVQMAGRAGRSKDDPQGNVYFAAYNRTKAQVNAIKQIKAMNAIARQRGYLRQSSEGGQEV